MNKRLKQLLMIVFAVALFLPQFGIAQKASAASTNGTYALKVQTTGGHQWDGAQIATGAGGLNLEVGKAYTFSYDVYTPDKDVAGIVLQTSGYNWIKNTGTLSAASPAWTSYSETYTYTATSGSYIQFVKTGDQGNTDVKNITYYIDNFVVKDASDAVVYTANFDNQTTGGFISSGDATLTAGLPGYFLKVQTTGGHQWDGAQIATGAGGLNLEVGKAYTFSYDVYTPDQDVAGIVLQTSGYNWIKNTGALSAASPAWTSYSETYTYTATSGSYIQFVKTGDSGATDAKNITYYIDNFVVRDANDAVVYTANFENQTTGGFISSGDATLTPVNSISGATTPTFNPDVLTLPSIKNTPRYTGYLMGSIFGPNYMQDPILSVLKAQFGVVTPENATKPDSLKGTSASTHNVADLDFNEADTELQSAIDNGLKIHGHTLVWESQSIPWLNNAKISDSDPTPSNPGLTAAQAYTNMNDYINAVLTHFDTKFNASTQNIISWDVVNEAFGGTVRDSSLPKNDWHSYLKATPWLKATDANYVEQAFKDARAAEPNYDVLLYYNDYSMDDQNKAAAVRDMVKDVNDRWAVGHPGKQLIQGVGLQEHNGLGTNPSNTRKTIQMFKDIGVKVSISELDISAGTGGTQTADQKTAQAAQYARLMQVYTDPAFKDTVQRITFWGLTDTASWLASGSPLLFDGKLYPKDSFNAVIDPVGYLANYHAPTKPAGGKTSTAAKGTPNVDGTMDDIWNTTSPIAIDVTQAGNTKAGTIMPAATARMLWDDANLYVFAQVTKDPSEPLDKGNANPWEQDSVEVVVDLTNGSTAMYSNASGHYRVRYDGFASVDAGMTDNQGKSTTVTSATSVNEATYTYTVEMKIPFIQITPAVGTQMGFDVQVNDAKAGVRIGAFAWNDATGTAYQDLFKIGTLQLAAAGSTSGGGGGDATPIVGGTTIETKEGQVTIKTVVTTENGVSTANVSKDMLTSALQQAPANADGKKQVTLEVPAQAGATAYGVQIPVANLKDSNSTVLSIKTENGTIDLPGNMLSNTDVGTSDKVTIRLSDTPTTGLSDAIREQIGDRPVLNLEAMVGGKVIAWNNPSAPVTVSVPYTPTAEELNNPDNIVIWYIDGNGKATPVTNAHYDAKTGTVQFKTTHFSNYAVAYVVKTFEDLASVPWAQKAIEAMAAHGIINGTSATTYAPNASIKRADFLLLLVRALELRGTDEAATMFDDVNDSDYYYDAVRIAKQLGIIQGTGDNLFLPDSKISRQDMMVIAARAAKAAGKTLPVADSLAAFSDAASVSPYARDSVSALVGAGIVQGTNGKLEPQGFLTRAEAAVILKRLWSK
ncbi:endo-1,4-beta-xylanase [Cohnella yongneupensis]|uniref:Beta-xylanase n=1 Tax=Cohnella yongneupensis TaxID=425006 RepID=A0ABW0R2B2_9BACL